MKNTAEDLIPFWLEKQSINKYTSKMTKVAKEFFYKQGVKFQKHEYKKLRSTAV